MTPSQRSASAALPADPGLLAEGTAAAATAAGVVPAPARANGVAARPGPMGFTVPSEQPRAGANMTLAQRFEQALNAPPNAPLNAPLNAPSNATLEAPARRATQVSGPTDVFAAASAPAVANPPAANEPAVTTAQADEDTTAPDADTPDTPMVAQQPGVLIAAQPMVQPSADPAPRTAAPQTPASRPPLVSWPQFTAKQSAPTDDAFVPAMQPAQPTAAQQVVPQQALTPPTQPVRALPRPAPVVLPVQLAQAMPPVAAGESTADASPGMPVTTQVLPPALPQVKARGQLQPLPTQQVPTTQQAQTTVQTAAKTAPQISPQPLPPRTPTQAPATPQPPLLRSAPMAQTTRPSDLTAPLNVFNMLPGTAPAEPPLAPAMPVQAMPAMPAQEWQAQGVAKHEIPAPALAPRDVTQQATQPVPQAHVQPTAGTTERAPDSPLPRPTSAYADARDARDTHDQEAGRDAQPVEPAIAPAPTIAPAPAIPLAGTPLPATQNAQAPADAALRERLIESVQQLLVSVPPAPDAPVQVRMVLQDSLLPGTAVTVQQVGAQLHVSFECSAHMARQRLDRHASGLAQALSRRLGRDVRVEVHDTTGDALPPVQASAGASETSQ